MANLLQNYLDGEIGNMNRQRWIIASLAFLSLIAFLFICHFTNRELSPEELQIIINRSEILKPLDHFCKKFPKPEGFEFVDKKLARNSEKSLIIYNFRTNLRFAEVKGFYLDYFEKDGWTRDFFQDENKESNYGMIYYKKGEKTISIEHISFPNADYSIGCGEHYSYY